MGDFNSETDMVQWGKQFVTKIFELCTDREVVCFKAQNSKNFSYDKTVSGGRGNALKQTANDWEVTVEANSLIMTSDQLRKSTQSASLEQKDFIYNREDNKGKNMSTLYRKPPAITHREVENES